MRRLNILVVVLPLCPRLQVVALTASPAGELDLPRTIVKIEELLARLGADLAAPVKTIDEVRACTTWRFIRFLHGVHVR